MQQAQLAEGSARAPVSGPSGKRRGGDQRRMEGALTSGDLSTVLLAEKMEEIWELAHQKLGFQKGRCAYDGRKTVYTAQPVQLRSEARPGVAQAAAAAEATVYVRTSDRQDFAVTARCTAPEGRDLAPLSDARLLKAFGDAAGAEPSPFAQLLQARSLVSPLALVLPYTAWLAFDIYASRSSCRLYHIAKLCMHGLFAPCIGL